MAISPEELMEPGSNAPDYSNDDPAIKNGWRRQTPPAGEDGTIPAVSETVKDVYDFVIVP